MRTRNNNMYQSLSDAHSKLKKCNEDINATQNQWRDVTEKLNDCQYRENYRRSLPSSCLSLENGLQVIQIGNQDPFKVLCDNSCITIQQRFQDNEDNASFDRNWKAYEDGFGNIENNYFIGLKTAPYHQFATTYVIHYHYR